MWAVPLGSAGLYFCFSTLGSAEILLPFMRGDVVAFLGLSRLPWALHLPSESFSNSPIRRLLVRRSASTSSVLACIVSNVPGGLLTTSPSWSCILGGLALLLLVFRVDTISVEISALFVKELSFPQTGPTDDDFFNRY